MQGPVVDELNKLGEMWVFGKDVKGREIYIKIMLGGVGCQTICVSFHMPNSLCHIRLKWRNSHEKPVYW